MVNLKKILATNFRNALKEQNFSAKDLAEATGWHVNLWKTRIGGITDIKAEDLVIAARAMKISPAWLVIRVVDPPPIDDRYTLILKELERVKQTLKQISDPQNRSCR